MNFGLTEFSTDMALPPFSNWKFDAPGNLPNEPHGAGPFRIIVANCTSFARRVTVTRIRQMIAVESRRCWTLFHPSTRNTYVTPSVAELLKTHPLPRPMRTALSGAMKESSCVAVLEADIQHHPISTHALVVEEIGDDEDGNPIEILFGALAMQQWGIRLKPSEERLDLSHYPKEFVQF